MCISGNSGGEDHCQYRDPMSQAILTICSAQTKDQVLLGTGNNSTRKAQPKNNYTGAGPLSPDLFQKMRVKHHVSRTTEKLRYLRSAFVKTAYYCILNHLWKSRNTSATIHNGRYVAATLHQKSLCSSVMSFSGSKPTQALITLTSALLCLPRALTTGVPVGVSGALSM